VTVTTEIVPQSLAAAETLQGTVIAALERFLHPLTGRWDGQGWPLGRRPYRSDLYRLLEAVPGVQHVQSLAVAITDPSKQDAVDRGSPSEAERITFLSPAEAERFLIYSGRHQITLGTDAP
jgi:hypothetical protein